MKIPEMKLEKIIMVAIILIAFPVTVLFTSYHYSTLKSALLEDFRLMMAQSEKNISDTFSLVDTAYKVLEVSFDTRMKEDILKIAEMYKKTGGHPERLNLPKIKQQFNNVYDIYFINRNGVIDYTTYENDIGLDFKKYKTYYKNLQKVFEKEGYVADRITHETSTQQVRKFGYITTYDKKYILELGIVSNDFNKYIADLEISKLIELIKDYNPALKSVKVLGIDNYRDLEGSGYTLTGKNLEFAEKTRNNKQPSEFVNDKNNELIRYIYVDLADDNYIADESRLVELVYSTEELNSKINELIYTQIFLILLIMIFVVAVSIYISKLLSRSIREVVEGINKISEGDFSRQVEVKTRIIEVNTLQKSVNKMAISLKKMDSEKNIRLAESEKMAQLGRMIAGIAHDVNTPLGIGITAVSHLRKSISNIKEKYNSKKMTMKDFEEHLDSSDQSCTMVQSNLERASSIVKSFKQIAADQSGGEKRKFMLTQYVDEIIMSLHPELKKTKIEVHNLVPNDIEMNTAAGALSQILVNLIINSKIHGFPDQKEGNIEIKAELSENNVILSYSDDGKGIDEENISKVFEPYFTTRKGIGGTGLGLHMVKELTENILKGKVAIMNDQPGVKFQFILPGNLD